MKTYLFDVNGTVEGNIGGLLQTDAIALILRLRARGNRVVLWTAGDVSRIHGRLVAAVDEVTTKLNRDYFDVLSRNDFVVIDDEGIFLTLAKRWGAKTIHAAEMSRWYQTDEEPADYVEQFRRPVAVSM